jgi:cyclase
MKNVIMVLAVLAMAAVGSQKAWSQDDVSYTPVEVSKLTDNLYMITCTAGEEFNLPPFGTNLIASVGPDGILLVDTGPGETAEMLRDTLASLGNGQVRAIIATHHHGDHIAGNRIFADKSLILGQNGALNLSSGNYYNLPGTVSPDRPQVGFDDSLIIYFNSDEIHVVHAPACHTGGDAFVYFKGANIVAAGDLFFADEIPFIDVRSGGTVDGYIRQIRTFIETFPDNTTFIPSHGRAYTKTDLQAYEKMLMGTATAIRSARSAGKTVEEAIAADILADWSKWNGSFPTTTRDFWIRYVYFDADVSENGRSSICEPLTRTLAENSAEEAVEEYYRLKTNSGDKYDYSEDQLNMLGYQLLMRGRADDALRIFRLNMEVYPGSFNVYDSYAEALMTAGDTAQSIANYEKSLELNPENDNAAEMLKKLKP